MRRSTILALSLLSFGALLPAACTQNFDIFGPSGGTGAGGGTGGSTPSSSSSTSSSSSGTVGCTADGECDDQNPCTTDACSTSTKKCVNTALADGPVPGSTDTTKDCKTNKCVGGMPQMVADDTDVPDNTNPCVTVACDNGNVSTNNVASGMSCGQNQQKCDGNGNCVGCQQAFDCPQVGDCQQRNCDAQHVCSPTNRAAGTSCNANGGNVCDGMGACVACNDNGDCNGPPEICVNHACVSSCGDGTKNGNETDVDCGGACATKCADGKNCNGNNDCTSKVCKQQAGPDVCAAPTCTDTVQNGVETDVDCGGTCTTKCGDGKKCMVDGDCQSTHCNPTTKLCVVQCSDGVKDGNETDVDCGGSCSTKCVTGKGCAVDGDCQSAHCNPTTMLCATQCTDGVKDGNESDIDCGGTCTTKCADGKSCGGNGDCANGYCDTTTMKCATPTCTDGAKNGSETDVDCGGSCATKCMSGQGCLTSADCVGGVGCIGNPKHCQ